MPAVLKSTEGSFSGTSDAEGMIACARAAKNARNFARICAEVSGGDIGEFFCKTMGVVMCLHFAEDEKRSQRALEHFSDVEKKRLLRTF